MKCLGVLMLLLLASCTSQTISQCVDVQSCGNRIHNNIQSNLFISNSDIGKNVKLHFVLDDNTEIIEIDVIESSGDKKFDRLAIRAVEDSFPDKQLLELTASEYEQVREIYLTVSPR